MFKKKQVHSLAGGADVTQYLKAAPISNWLILILVAVTLAGMFAWSLVGTVRTTVELKGINEGGHMVCFVDSLTTAGYFNGNFNQPVEYEGRRAGVVTGHSNVILDNAKVREEVDNEFVFQELGLAEQGSSLTIDVDVDPTICPDGVLTVNVVLSEMHPFSLFAG